MPTFQAYKTILKQLIDSNNYTSVRVAALTKAQFASAIGLSENDPRWSDRNIGFFTNLRRHAIDYALYKEALSDFAAIKSAIKSAIKTYMDGNWEGYEAEHEAGDYPVIHLYYKGKRPEVIE